MEYKPIIGLEVHVQLKTKSKLFCSCPVEFGGEPNSRICPICTGQPGVLPVLNEVALRYAIISAIALNCKINEISTFARKHYFYPDLPKNYQISQYDQPLATNGYIEIELKDGTRKKIRIKRLHLEEDAGKLLHAIGSQELDYSLVDFNRAGIPLIEIVSEPDINSPDEAYSYLTLLKTTLRYLGVSDCDMEKGSLRCDANVSVIKADETIKHGLKIELKNMNSFKAVKEAIEYEIKRQVDLIESGEELKHETRLWNPDKKMTQPMRTKEEAHDYRYFPDPDLPPLIIRESIVEAISQDIPELPLKRKDRFKSQYGLSDYDAGVLTSDKALADYFEKTVNYISGDIFEKSKLATNWITTELLGKLNAENKTIEESPVPCEKLAEMIELIMKKEISSKIAKEVFNEMYESGLSPQQIISAKNLRQISDEEQLKKVIDDVVNSNPNIVSEYLSGKQKAFMALVGQVMKATQGKANPQLVNTLLKQKLDSISHT